jgi:hypothetical protein
MHVTTAARLGIGLCVVFLAILCLLHILEPEFNPPHLISEYQLGRFAWLMSLAFFSLGGASLAVLAVVRQGLKTRLGRLGGGWLLVVGLAYFVAGLFPPDPSRYVVGLLHGIAGLIVIFSSPIVFTLITRDLLRGGMHPLDGAGAFGARLITWAAGLAWLGLLLFCAFLTIFRVKAGPEATIQNTASPEAIIAGWTNRFLIVSYVAWLLAAAAYRQSGQR